MVKTIVRCASISGGILAALLCLVACATPITVGADYDSQADFSGWRTWSDATPAGAPMDSLTDRRIRGAVERVLTERGFARAPAESADFLVGHQTQVHRETDVVSTGYDPYWGAGGRYRGGWGGSTHVYQYDVGTLVIDLLDRRGGFVAWRGRASSTLDSSLEPAERDQRIEEAVRKMLAQFPPAAR